MYNMFIILMNTYYFHFRSFLTQLGNNNNIFEGKKYVATEILLCRILLKVKNKSSKNFNGH